MRLVFLWYLCVCFAECQSAAVPRWSICSENQQNPFILLICRVFRILFPNQPPVIQNEAFITIPENTIPGSVVAQVTIIDHDGPSPPNLTVLTGPVAAQPVTMTIPGVFSASLVLVDELDKEQSDTHVIRFHVTDGVEDIWSSIVLRVSDVNEAPVFTKKLYSTTIPNSAVTSSLLVRIQATDPESHMLTYLMQSNNTFVLDHFQVNPSSGNVLLSSALSAISNITTYRFEVVARDTAGLTSTTEVEVTVVPDNPVTVPPQTGLVPPLLLNNTESERIVYFNDGESIQLPCVAAADAVNPPSYTWEKDGAVLSTGGRLARDLDSGGLHISNLTETDVGDYRCFAANQFGRSMGTRYRLKVRYLGNFSSVPRDVVAATGEYLRVVCMFPPWDAESRTIFWQYRDSPDEEFQDFNYSSSVVPTTSDALIFRLVNKSDFPDGRVLRCGISVGHGMVAYGHDIPVRILEVVSAPQDHYLVYSSQPVVRVVPGLAVTMNCIYSGRPLPDQTWTRSNISGTPLSGRLWNTQYHIESVTTEDAGDYICTATGARNTSDSTRFTLVVDEKPWFRYSPEDMEVSGGSARFSCMAEGVPKPYISWFINGEPLDTTLIPATREGRVSVEQPSGDLVINNVGAKDTMVVGCMAFNFHGSIYQEGRLIYKVSK